MIAAVAAGACLPLASQIRLSCISIYLSLCAIIITMLYYSPHKYTSCLSYTIVINIDYNF